MVRICVLGAGINGLASATEIQKALPYADVTIIAEQFTPNTTSDASGGWWMPLSANYHPDKEIWARRTYEYLIAMATSTRAADSGIQMIFGYVINEPGKILDLGSYVKSYRPMTPEELALFPNARFGVFFMSAVLECITFLPWLTERYLQKGGTLKCQKIRDLAEVAGQYDVIVNCTSLGSRSLVEDTSIYPARGQVLKVKAPWIKYFIKTRSDKEFSYILPGAKYVTVGGTFTKDSSDTSVSDSDTADIWDRCIKWCPQLTGAKVAKTLVGLRPLRPEVRLELEHVTLPNGGTIPVVHNYGQGGSGISIFKGCAEEVAAIVTSLPVCAKPLSKL